jgi:hypothetical protein
VVDVQRWFVIHNGPEPVTDQVLQRELDYVFTSFDKVKKNESSWNYLRGLVRYHPDIKQEVTEKVTVLVKDGLNHYLALGLLADLRYTPNTLPRQKVAR